MLNYYCVFGMGRERRGRGEEREGTREGRERRGDERGEGEGKREERERGGERIGTHILMRLEPDPYILSIISKLSLSSILCTLFLTLS